MADIGNTLPKVAVKDSEDRAVDLAALTGPLALYFYPKADTPGCTNEGKDFTALAGEFSKLGCAIYGISKDKPAKLAKFKAKYDFDLTLLSDEEGAATEQMGVWVEKNMYGRKYMGIERATFLIGKDDKIAQIWRKVRVKGHAEAVLEAAKALG
ncbi:MAG: peroxiredoxin [Sphingorhabdus sp.]